MTFKVQLDPSGRSFTVQDDETLLAAALRQNVGLPYGCRSGCCGSCAARLCAGELTYPDGEPPALAGQSVALKLSFDTMDAWSNSGEGVYIDDLKLVTGCP